MTGSPADSRTHLEVVPGRAPVGGGSLPGFELDTNVVVIRGAMPPEELAERLRRGSLPVVGRVHDGAFRIDLRTVFEDEVDGLVTALEAALGATPN